MTPEGIPITHAVFAGNVSDKQTVPDILKRLKEDFAVEQCVFGGDRGMVTEANMALMAEAGFPSMVGFHQRGRLVSDTLLEPLADVSTYHELKDHLRYLEVPATRVDDVEQAEGVRYILCYNPEKARQDTAFRESALEAAEAGLKAWAESLAKPKRGRKPTDKGVMLQVADRLTRKGVEAFVQVDDQDGILTYRRDEDALNKEALRDGKFLIRTHTDWPAADVVQSYQTLMGIERAFHQIKNFRDVGFEQEMPVLYRRQWARDTAAAESLACLEERTQVLAELELRWYTVEAIVRELRRWKAVRATFLGKEFVSVTQATDRAQGILASLGIPTPTKTLSVTKAQHMTSAE